MTATASAPGELEPIETASEDELRSLQVTDDLSWRVELQVPATRGGAGGHPADVGDDLLSRPGGAGEQVEPDGADADLVERVKLASAGVVGSIRAFEGEHGVLKEFTDTPHPDRLTAGLGQRWDLLDMGIKPYPANRATHGAIDAAL